MLTGGPRIDDRHRSVRATLDWSYALLDEANQAALRRVSVFAGPFTATAAVVVVAGWPPVPTDAVPTILAGLADQSLLIAIPGPGGTRYRALETIRQYSAGRLEKAGESVEALSWHLSWCLDESADLELASRERGGTWRAAVGHPRRGQHPTEAAAKTSGRDEHGEAAHARSRRWCSPSRRRAPAQLDYRL
jgi:predicted ATPase